MQLIAMGIYLALGDSISIDDYTGVYGGGSAIAARAQARRRARRPHARRQHDTGVLADLARAPAAADVVTLTAGGNDLLGGDLPRAILRRLHQIADRIQPRRLLLLDLRSARGRQRGGEAGRALEDRNREQLYEIAKQKQIPGHSKIGKWDLIKAIRRSS